MDPILAIDVGNSRVSMALFEQGALRNRADILSAPLPAPEALLAQLDAMRPSSPPRVRVASVVPALNTRVINAFPEAVILDWRATYSFEIKTQPPDSTGVDRLVTAHAASILYGSPVIVVDAGTATTFSVVSRAKTFVGGAIAPGLKTGRDALVARAAQLHEVELNAPPRAMGTTTTEAIQSGLMLGHASMIDGMIRRFRAELVEPQAPAILTGGWAPFLATLCEEISAVDTNLTLKGIAYLEIPQ